MLNAGIILKGFNGSQVFNHPNWDGIIVEVNYPSGQTAELNPIVAGNYIVDQNGSVWEVILSEANGRYNQFVCSLSLRSNYPTVDIAPDLGNTSQGAVTELNENGLNPYWDETYVSTAVARATLAYNIIHVTNKSNFDELKDSISEKSNLAHKHSMDDVNGISVALGSKSNLLHTHVITDVGNLDQELASKAALVHGHGINDIVGLSSSLSELATSTFLNSEISALDIKIDSKLPSTANAVSASKLKTARTIALTGDVTGSIIFDGSANVSMVTTVNDYSHNHSILDVEGLDIALDERLLANMPAVSAHKFSVARNFVLSGGVTGEVLFDGSNNINLLTTVDGTRHTHLISSITGLQNELNNKVDKTGESSSASQLTFARNISLTGDATGSILFDGSSDEIFDVVVKDNSHLHMINNISGLQTELDSKATHTYVSEQLDTLLAAAPGTLDTLNEIALALGEDPNFATTMTVNLASKLDKASPSIAAHKLVTPRSISLGGDVTGTMLFDGSSNITLNATVLNNSHTHFTSTIDGLDDALSLKLNVTGVAQSATKLNESRIISLVGDVTGAFDFDGTTDKEFLTVIADNSHNHLIENISGLEIELASKLDVGGISISAHKLAIPRVIDLRGGVTGSLIFDGSSDRIVDTIVTNNSHLHLISNIDTLQNVLDSKASLTYVDDRLTSLIGAAPESLDTLSELALSLANDSNFSATVINSLAGKLDKTANAVSATKLATPREVRLSGDVTGSVVFDGTSDVSITTTVQDYSHTHALSETVGLPALLETKATKFRIRVSNWSSGTWLLPFGWTAVKEYSDTSIRITHSLNELPMSWMVLNRASTPMVAVVPSATRNLQVIDANTLIITQVGVSDIFDITLTF
jgi:phage I-like protein